MSEYPRYSVAISAEEEARAKMGRAARRPQPDVGIRRSTRSRASQQVEMEEFWEEVVSGRLVLQPLPVKTPAEVSAERDNAALFDRQLVALTSADFVSRIIEY